MAEPSTALEWKNRGNELFSQDDIDGALNAYSKAIELEPENAVYYSNRAAAYTFKRDFAKGVADAQKAIELNKVYPKAWIRLGIAEYSRGDFTKALDAFQTAKDLAKSESDGDEKIRQECDSHMRLCEEEIEKQKNDQQVEVHDDEKAGGDAAMEMTNLDDVADTPHPERGLAIPEAPNPPCCTKEWRELWLHPGNLANLLFFAVTIVGFCMKYINNPTDDGQECRRRSCAYIWPISAGLFAVGGGVTNWVAIKMLFDKIPGVYGSGIIPARFKEIREVVKNVIMKNFFDETYLNHYLKDKVLALDIEGKLEDFLKSDSMVKMLEGLFGGDAKMLIPIIQPYAVKTGKRIAPIIKDKIRNMDLLHDLENVKGQIDAMLTNRMMELTPAKVKLLLEEIMRKHLYWLVVWGNVFGAIIGVISAAVGLP